MAKFLYLYSGGQMAETPEAQEESMRVWTAWFSRSATRWSTWATRSLPARRSPLAEPAKARRPSWAATRSSTLNLSTEAAKKATDVPSCSPAAALRCTRLCLCDPRDPSTTPHGYSDSASSAAEAETNSDEAVPRPFATLQTTVLDEQRLRSALSSGDWRSLEARSARAIFR